MKKVLYSITFLILAILCIKPVNAASFDLSLTGNTNFENQITLRVNVADLEGFATGIYGFTGYLDYDTDKLKLDSIIGLANFELGYGDKSKKIVLFKEEGVNSGTNILELTFQNIGLTNGEETTIKINKIKVSDGDRDLGDGSYSISKKIKLVLQNEPSSKPSSSSASSSSSSSSKPSSSSASSSSSSSSKPSSSSSSSSSASSQPEEKKSNNNYLASITLSAGTINFSKETLIYDLLVAYDVEKININAQAEDSKAKVTGIDIYELKEGINKVAIVVTAEDKSTRTYLLNITREKEDIEVNVEEPDNDESQDEIIIPDNESNKDENININNSKQGFIVPFILVLVILTGTIIVVVKNKKRAI